MKMTMNHKSVVSAKGILVLMVAISLLSCSKDDDSINSQSENNILSLSVIPGSWDNSSNAVNETRASYSSITESSNGNKTFTFSFTSGDAIGLFALDETGKVVLANEKWTYSGSKWTTDSPMEYISTLRNYTFFAYYPWVSSLSGAPALNSTPNISTALNFFSDAITAWTPAADQGSLEKFTAQDFMVAKGTVTTPYFHEVQVAFTMARQMGLLVTKSTLSYYDFDNPSDTWTVPQVFSPNVPYTFNGLCYYIAKPGVATTLGSKTATVQKMQVEQLYFTNGEPGSR